MCQLGLIALKLNLFELQIVSLAAPLNERAGSLLHRSSLLCQHREGYLEPWLEHLIEVLRAQGVNNLPLYVYQARIGN